MKVDLLDIKGKKIKELELPASIFESSVNVDLMHQAYIRQIANARLGTHDTKVRAEVSGGGRKPWRQKGTGRARQGSIRAAQWVGGGRIHTPHPRDYDQRMPRKMRHAALRSALSSRASQQEIVVVDEMIFDAPKSNLLAKTMKTLVGKNSVLLVLPDKDARLNVYLAANNIDYVKVIFANYLNIRDLLKYDRIVFDVSSLPIVEGYLADEARKK